MQVRAIERGDKGSAPAVTLAGSGWAEALPGGRLPLACLHEIEPARLEWDDGPALGFCLALLGVLRGTAERRPVLWAAPRGDLHGPGLADFGFAPSWLIEARTKKEAQTLWALEEGLRSAALCAVVGEVEAPRALALRRLQLAAEAGGATAFLLRRPLGAARRSPAAAVLGATRWRVAAAPSGPGRLASLPGRPRWSIELLRCRGGRPGRFLVEWDDETGDFGLVAALRDGAAAALAGVDERRVV
jgi:protein ImuA